MSKKDELIQQLQEELDWIYDEHDALTRAYNEVYRELYYPDVERKDSKVKNIWNRIRNSESKKAGTLSFDYWPIADWFRLEAYRYDQGRSFQITVGPLRLTHFVA